MLVHGVVPLAEDHSATLNVNVYVKEPGDACFSVSRRQIN